MSGASNVAAASSAPVTARFSQSAGFAGLLGSLDLSLAFTSYQSGLRYLLGRLDGGLLVLKCAL